VPMATQERLGCVMIHAALFVMTTISNDDWRLQKDFPEGLLIEYMC
jgi:hypothetical protein